MSVLNQVCRTRVGIELGVAAIRLFALALVPCSTFAAEMATQCLIEPSMRVSLRSSVSAQIVSVLVDRGATVKKGQPLVTLDSSVEKAAIDSANYRAVMEGQTRSAQARLANSQLKLKRREELLEQRFVSTQDRDDAAADMRVAEADLIEAKDNRQLSRLDAQRLGAEIGRRQLNSPINGVVLERLQNPGELAQAGEGGLAILKLAQVDPARIEVVLPASRRGKIKLGDVVTIRAEAPFNGSYKAVVKVVDAVVDSASGTFGVRLELPNPKQEVPLGVKCTAEF